MKLFHVTTNKKAKLYRATGFIQSPVRGFRTLMGAMAWAIKCGRTVIYEIQGSDELCHKLPDHHNRYGEAWWFDQNINKFDCVFSAEKDA